MNYNNIVPATPYVIRKVAINGTPDEAQDDWKQFDVEVKTSNPDHIGSYYLIDVFGDKDDLEALMEFDSVFDEEEIEVHHHG